MWFQQIEEILEPPQHPAFPKTEFPTRRARSPTRQMNISEVIEDSPSNFKRVRLLYQGHDWDEHLKKLNPVLFIDARGRKFSFPFRLCYHWAGMAQLITESFQYDMSMGPRVTNGQYDIVSSTGNIIPPQDWEATIEPGISVTMHMWSILDSDSAELARDTEPPFIEGSEPEVENINSQTRNYSSKNSNDGNMLIEEDGKDLPQERVKDSKVTFSLTNNIHLQASNDESNTQKAPVAKPKGILSKPREKFFEDAMPVREGVAPLRDGIPPDSRWTKISRRMVNPEALEAGKERFEAKEDFVIVLRVLTREEVQAYATATRQIRCE